MDFNLIVSHPLFDLFLTTVYNKRTHDFVQPTGYVKITILIMDEYHRQVFWVLKKTVSSKYFF